MKKQQIINIILNEAWLESKWIINSMLEHKEKFNEFLIVNKYTNKINVEQIKYITRNWDDILNTFKSNGILDDEDIENRNFELGGIIAYWKMLKIIQGDNND